MARLSDTCEGRVRLQVRSLLNQCVIFNSGTHTYHPNASQVIRTIRSCKARGRYNPPLQQTASGKHAKEVMQSFLELTNSCR